MSDNDPSATNQRTKRRPEVNPDQTFRECTAFVTEIAEEADADGLVIDLDGGPDSALVTALGAEALGPERVQALLITTNASPEETVRRARTIATDLGVSLRRIDAQPLLEAFLSRVATTVRERRWSPFERASTVTVANRPDREGVPDATANAESRLRMAIAYFEANTTRSLVAGSANRTDRLLAGAKYGATGVDCLPIGHLYRTDVLALGSHPAIPRPIPTDCRTTGPACRAKTVLPPGVSATAVDDVLRLLADDGFSVAEVVDETAYDSDLVRRLAAAVDESAHDRPVPPTPST